MREPRPRPSADRPEDRASDRPDNGNRFTEQVGIEVPLICGAMYPCSNPELVAAVSAAGGIGIVQPISMIYVHGHDLRQGLRLIRKITDRPVGFNAIIEKSVKAYEKRMRGWIDVALEEGVRFFITALGNPRWVVDKVHGVGGTVYHDVTERKWALKALDAGIDGLICVNNRAGGHAGTLSLERLHAELGDLGMPLICAGGIGQPAEFANALEIGYDGAQLGTRFIATDECKAHSQYKQAILDAREDDIVLTVKLSGVPVSVINTPYVERVGTRAGPIARRLLRGRRTRHWMRTLYALKSLRELKLASLKGSAYRDYWQAGKSVHTIHEIRSAGDIVGEFRAELTRKDRG